MCWNIYPKMKTFEGNKITSIYDKEHKHWVMEGWGKETWDVFPPTSLLLPRSPYSLHCNIPSKSV